MNTLYRILRYIKLHLFSDPRYFFTYLWHFFDPNYIIKADFYTNEEMVSYIEKGKSFIRIGDGEIYLLNRGSLGFQEYDPLLREKLLGMVKSYSPESSYLLGFNVIPLQSTNKSLRKINLLNSWLPSKVYFDLYFNKNVKYVDASVFYYNDTVKNYLEKFLLSKRIILVSKKEYIDNFKNNKAIPFKDVSFVETLDKNAFRDFFSLKEKVLLEVEKYGKDKSLVLISCGPAGKVLAYDLLDKVQVLDIGLGVEIIYSNKKIDYIANPFLVRK